jgi:hypothetical protein
MKLPSVCASLIAAAIAFVLVFGNLSISMILVSGGAAAIVYAVTNSIQYATGSAIVALFGMAGLMRYGVIKKEGFNVFTSPTDIAKSLRRMREGFKSKNDEEDFKDKHDDDEGFKGRKDDEEDFRGKNDDEEGFKSRRDDEEDFRGKNDDEEGFKSRRDDEEDFRGKNDDEEGFKGRKDDDEDFKDKHDDEEGFKGRKDDEEDFRGKNDDEEGFMNMNSFKSLKEGFFNKVFQNISTAGYTRPGFGMGAPLLEGFEDQKKVEKKGKPAPTMKKEEMAMPFKLGEIPSQVKNGPHIDAGSTLIKAIQGLNPDQINAMTKDTKQLIETQKSLMGMLGSMKPMMNDGKELMETFQQMFGENAKI